jgi:purine-nucleoside phosphorylase
MTYERLVEAAEAIAKATDRERHSVGLVLGSGLGDYAASLPGAVEVPYDTIPHFPVPKVEGHAGTIHSVEVEGRGVLVLSGRVHAYEGWDMDDVVFGVRCAALAGCAVVLLTNAAGGVGPYLRQGDLVAVRDHINLAGRNPLYGPNDERLGPRFPDLSDVYSEEIRDEIEAVAQHLGITFKTGVYAWFLGPSYETPAEIDMVERIGGDLVGMSTVPEAIALAHMGVKVGCISLVTNLAAGIADQPISHDEVTETALLAKEKFAHLLDELLPRLVGLM